MSLDSHICHNNLWDTNNNNNFNLNLVNNNSTHSRNNLKHSIHRHNLPNNRNILLNSSNLFSKTKISNNSFLNLYNNSLK
jgi:hypothetical protein